MLECWNVGRNLIFCSSPQSPLWTAQKAAVLRNTGSTPSCFTSLFDLHQLLVNLLV